MEGLQTDGGTEDACWAQQQGAQAGDDPIGGRKLGVFPAATQDRQFLPKQYRFVNERNESPPGLVNRVRGDDQMNKEDSEIPDSGNGISRS